MLITESSAGASYTGWGQSIQREKDIGMEHRSPATTGRPAQHREANPN
jgi:hypothetical protein